MYPNSVVKLSKQVKPSKRGELEITDLNKIYLNLNKLEFRKMGRGYAWFDAGSEESLFEVTQLIRSIENRMGYKIACIEEIALNKNWISKYHIKKILKNYSNSEYSKYLKGIING